MHHTPPTRRTLLHYALGLSAALASSYSPLAWAQTQPPAWPNKPVKILVGFPGGSSPDLTARVLSEALAQQLGQPFIVDNRTGAGGNIAARSLARAQDAHTISVMINGNMTIADLISDEAGYSPLNDLQPIALVGSAPLVLVAPAEQVGQQDGAAFLSQAKAAGNTWNYGSPGIGTVAHIGMELVKAKANLQTEHVPYAGNPQVLQALLSGEIQLALLPPALALAHQKSGKLVLVGITSAQTSSLTPGLPTLQDLGIPGLNLEIWNAVAAPAHFAPEHAAALESAVRAALEDQGMQEKLRQQGWEVRDTSRQSLERRITNDIAVLGEIIRTQNIKNQ